MYTRTYSEDVGEIIIPEKYGGTSFSTNMSDEHPQAATDNIEDRGKNPWEKEEEVHTSATPKTENEIPASTFANKSFLSGFLSNIFKNKNFSLQKIGTEEILIVATAVFLFLSKEGDKECAIMLILLLFLK